MRKIFWTIAICLPCAVSTFSFGQQEGDDCEWSFDAVIGANAFDTTNATPSSTTVDEAICPGSYLDWGKSNQDIWFKFVPTEDLKQVDIRLTCCTASLNDVNDVTKDNINILFERVKDITPKPQNPITSIEKKFKINGLIKLSR